MLLALTLGLPPLKATSSTAIKLVHMLYIKHLTINFLIATSAVCSVIIKALASGYG